MRSRRGLLVLGSIMLLGFSSLACTCERAPLNENTVAHIPFIVTGRTVQLHQSNNDMNGPWAVLDTTRSYTADIEIITSFKGGLKEGSRIVITSGGTDCNMAFSLGISYLLFFDIIDGAYRMWPCSYDQQLGEWSKDELEIVQRMTPDHRGSVSTEHVEPKNEAADEQTPDNGLPLLPLILGLVLGLVVVLGILIKTK
ncbi:MAG: hypothetical protein ABI432_19735 [Flavobacteriales bacterium]